MKVSIMILRIVLLIFSFQLIGCGGSGTGLSSLTEIEDNSLYDLSSSQGSDLELITVDGATLQLTQMNGMFVRNNGSASVVLTDKVTGINEEIANAIPRRNMTSFVTIIPEGNLLDGSFGIVGLPNLSENILEGNFSYHGNAEIFINDGKALYGLTGSSKILFEFDGKQSNVSGEVTSLTGKKSFLDLSCRDCSASAVVDILLPTGNICNGNRICFNSLQLRNSTLDVPLTNNYKLNSDGTLFGPNASELGTVFSVTDTESGSIEIRGATVGKRN